MNRRVAAAVLFCAAGCAGRAPVTSPDRAAPAGLRMEARGRVDVGGERHRFEAAVAVLSPDRLRVEIAGPMGGTRAVLAMREDQVIVLLPTDRIVIEGRATAGMFESLLGLRLEGRALVRLLDSLARDDAAVAAEPGLRVTREDGLLVAEADPAQEGGFRRLELRVRHSEMVSVEQMPDSLFAPPAPAGWRRLDPSLAPPGSPLLLP